MNVPNTPTLVSKIAQEGILAYSRQCYQNLNQQWNIREQLRQVDLAYIREEDWTKENWRGRIANSYGDADKYQNITVPVVLPQVETAVSYQSSVFLSGEPIFGVVASPQYEDEALQMETVISENSVRGGWPREIMLAFRDGFKYNLFALECQWDREVTAAFETDLGFAEGKQGKPKEIIWEGNCIRRWDLYNTFFDTRVAPVDIATKGEFVGKTELMGRVELKAFINSLPDKMVENITAAFNSGMGGITSGGMSSGGIESYYIPQINPLALINKNTRATTDWMAWAGITGASSNGKILYQNLYEVTILYGRIIPSDFNLKVPSPNTPQVWKFILVNHQVLIYAERQTNAHGWIPVLFGQPLEDGLWYQTKSLAQNVQPIQSVSSALMNSVIAARRRAISDRVIYDPSRITESHINSPNPSAKIPVRPSAYGKNVQDSVYAFPFRDDQSAIALSEIQQLGALGNVISGHNQSQQGQFVKGNKTLHEYADVMNHANGRDQMCSILLEHQVFTPLKTILKLNILQYQGGTSIYNPTKNRQVQIDPVALRKAVVEFKISDGLIPSDKLINAETMQVALQVMGSTPAIASQYNIAGVFSYLMKTQGAHLKEFEKSSEQLAYEQALQAWQAQVQNITEEMKVVIRAAGEEPLQNLINKYIKSMPPQPVPQTYGYKPSPAPTGVQ